MNQGPQSQRLRPFKPVRFGRYTLLMPISTGGMGEIFLARLEGTHGFDKLCVIKKILAHLAEDPEFVERFVNEARVLGQLSHGAIAQVLDMGVHEGAPYIALEFVDGKDLRRVLARARERQAKLPLPFVLFAMSRVLDALAYAHRKRGEDDRELNLVHRDVSPQNLLVSYEGEVKIIDFGLAKSTLSSARTNPSIIMGKFRYMSPEQARHQRVDKRSDLYAVGLCLYELVSGQSPFDAVPPGELMTLVGNPTIKPLIEAAPWCPPALSDVVMKALAIEPAQRFQSAEELRARLAALLVELEPAAGPETAARFMHETFSIEYLAERKMLSSLREHARSVGADETIAATPDGGLHPTVQALPTLVEGAPAEDPVTQPPRRPPVRRPVGADARETQQAVPVLEVPPSTPPRPVSVETSNDAKTPPAATLSAPYDELAAEPLPPPPSQPSRPRVARPATRSRVVSRPSGALVDRKKLDKSQERPAAKREPARAEPTKSGPGVLVWLVLPLLAVLAVAGYIAWDLYADALKTRQLEDERGSHDRLRGEPAPDRRSREVQVHAPDEDLTALPVQPRVVDLRKAKKPAPLATKPASAPESALRLLEADFARLTDESRRKRFQLKVNKLESELASRAQEPAYLDELKRLDLEIKAELAKEQPQ